jgi:hypothetical protein
MRFITKPRQAAFLALIALFVAGLSAIASASVSTDQADYPPGSVVTISGDNSDAAGYLDGETVHVDVSGPNGYAASCDGTADPAGAWSCQVTLWDTAASIGDFSYTATGSTSGVSQSGTFTDAGCPGANAIGNFDPAPGFTATYTTAANTATYSFTSTNKNPVGGIPGLIEYCVYTSPMPNSTSASYDSWTAGVANNNQYFSFGRPNGDPTNLPLDGSTQTIGSATWTGGVPATQTILLHVNDATLCHELYGGSSDTCFVLPGGPSPTSAISTTIHRVNGLSEINVTNGFVYVGSTVHDHATVTTTVNNIPAGSTVTFSRYAGLGCSGTPVATQSVMVPSGSNSATVQTSPNLVITASMVPGISFGAVFNSGNTGSTGVPNAGPAECENLTVKPDTTPPSCVLTATIPGPPTQIKVTAQDTASGIKTIVVTTKVNATVTWPAFVQGTTSPVVVTGTKTIQSQSSQVALRVTDLAGNITDCDPVIVNALGLTKVDIANVPTAEHVVTVYNGDPGLATVTVKVNGKQFVMSNLKAGEKRNIDIASALLPGDKNAISLSATGSSKGTACVVIWDGV